MADKPTAMSGPYVPVYDPLFDSWKMIEIAERLSLPSPACAVGLCAAVWSVFTKQATDDFLNGPPARLRPKLEARAGVPGILDAMEAVGYVRMHPDAIEFVDYCATMGGTYRTNAATKKRSGKTGGEKSSRSRKSSRPAKFQAGASSTASSGASSGARSNELIKEAINQATNDVPPAPRRGDGDTHTPAASTSHDGIPGGLHPHFRTKAFQAFMRAHPRPRSEPEAWKEWHAIFAIDAEEDAATVGRIMESLAAWKQSREWQDEGGKFVKSAAGWLAGRFWEQPAPPSKDAPSGTAYPSLDQVREARRLRDQQTKPEGTDRDE